MPSKPANAAQKQWMKDITEWSICNLGLLYGNEYDGAIIQRHHVLGRTARHNKIHIGHWFVNPVPFELHDVDSNHPLNVTHHKHCFTDTYGSQRGIFEIMCNSMESQGYEIPPDDAYYAILDTRA